MIQSLKIFVTKHRLYLLFQAIALLILIHYTIFSEAGLHDGDSVTHYLISKYAWHYPKLFLDNWGKPFFILLSSPLAQFGYGGIQVFNILCGVISGWFCYRVAAKLGLNYAFTAPVFLFMTPVYLMGLPSGLTEISFGLVLIASICLLVFEKPILAAVVVSFLPFCRSEGILLLPVIGLYLLWNRKLLAIPFLTTGIILYSAIGYFVLHDFFWIAHTNPYHSGNLYGSGPLWHFAEHYIPIFGNLPGILFVLATIYFVIKGFLYFKNKTPVTPQTRFEIMVLWLCVMVYFTAHSIFWYKGLFASAGLWRVMAAIAPPFAIVCIRGMNWGIEVLNTEKWGQFLLNFVISVLNAIWYLLEYLLRNAIWVIVLIIIIYQPIHYFRLPQRLEQSEITIRDACNWVKEKGLQHRKIFYSHPFTKICLSLDPYDDEKSREMMYIWKGDKFGDDMPKGSIIIWEPGLGPKEDGIPLSLLQDTIKFRPLKTFETPHDKDKPAGYEVDIFERK